jgi:hypothetical protein
MSTFNHQSSVSNDQLLDAAFADVRRAFSYPLLASRPYIEREQLPGLDTALFNLQTHACAISAQFLDEVTGSGGLEVGVALRGILVHEIGHYAVFPRELSMLLLLGQAAEARWPMTSEPGAHVLIVNSYCDVVNNLDSLLDAERSDWLAALYRGLSGLQPRSDDLNSVLMALYGRLSGVELVDESALGEDIEQALAALCGIDYTTRTAAVHLANVVSFGECIEPFLPRQPDTDSEGNLTDGYRKAELNDALDALIRERGRVTYERTEDYVRRSRPDDTAADDTEESSEPPPAGVVGSDSVEWNDEQIPFYRRLAGSKGLFIARRMVRDDLKDLYPGEQVVFEVGDDLQRLNPWSSPWLIPGITQRWKERPGRRPEARPRIPDLLVVLDSSASMPHPRHVSAAVLTAFVLARNYHANGSSIGLMNFSSDILFVPPTRRLHHIYQAACAYWGGGTVLNIDKIREWLRRLRHETLGDMECSTEDDYRDLLERLDADVDAFSEKELIVCLPQTGPTICEALDTVLITDGAVVNSSELVAYLHQLGRVSRVFVFLVVRGDASAAMLEKWRRHQLENVVIQVITDAEDLAGLALGSLRG